MGDPTNAVESAMMAQQGHYARKRKEYLQLQRRKQLEENKRRLDAWFVEFDKDQTGLLDKEQLKALLLRVKPESEPTDEVLDQLIKLGESVDTTGDGEKDTTGISRASIEKVIDKHTDYMREQAFIDAAFTKFDENGSGALEQPQLSAFLDSLDLKVKVNEGDVAFVMLQAPLGLPLQSDTPNLPPFSPDRSLVMECACKAALTLARIPARQADKSGTDSITRDELLPAVGVWTSLMRTAVVERSKKSPFAIENALMSNQGAPRPPMSLRLPHHPPSGPLWRSRVAHSTPLVTSPMTKRASCVPRGARQEAERIPAAAAHQASGGEQEEARRVVR